MNTLYNWTATRGDDTITIHGVDAEDEAVVLLYVDFIEADLPAPIATTVDGDRWRLSLQPRPSEAAAVTTPDSVAA